MAPTATERAYVYAKERVLDGRYHGGELISEGDVASEMGLSRTPVREAFLQLESEGLLRLYPRRGALVVPVSAAEVEDVLETRRLVETYAIEQLCTSRVDIEDTLDALIARQEQAISSGDAVEFVEIDREFHRAIVATTENAILIGLHDSLRDRQSRMGLAAIMRDDSRALQILDEHRAIVRSVRARDPAHAGEVMRSHLERTLALLRGYPARNRTSEVGPQASGE